MDRASGQDPDRPKRVQKAVEDAAKQCEQLKERHAQQAQDFGYCEQVFKDLAPRLDGLQDDPRLANAEVVIRNFGEYTRRHQEHVKAFDPSASWQAFDTTAAISTNVNFIAVQNVRSAFDLIPLPEAPPIWDPSQTSIYADRLFTLDPELKTLLLSVWQSYSNVDDNGRAALFEMRQLLDHFFAVLAPDEKVKKSPYFSQKGKKDPERIDRRERMSYAAYTRISDPSKAKGLANEAEVVLSTYKDLNELHKRGVLNRDEVRKTLTMAEHIVRHWVDALGL